MGFATGRMQTIASKLGGSGFYLEAYGVEGGHRGTKDYVIGGVATRKSLGMHLVQLICWHAKEQSLDVLARVRKNNVVSCKCLRKAAEACGRDFQVVPVEKDYRDIQPEVMFDKVTAWEQARKGREDVGEETAEDRDMKREREEYQKKGCVAEIEQTRRLNLKHGLLQLYRMPLK